MRNIKIIFLIPIIVLVSSYSHGAEKQKLTIQEVYDLQERCNKSSSEFFKKMYGTGYDFPGMTHHYDCHYNRKLNKCFIRIITLLQKENSKKENNEENYTSIEIYDVQENKIYGLSSQSLGKYIFNGVDVKSEENWKHYATPFMEE